MDILYNISIYNVCITLRNVIILMHIINKCNLLSPSHKIKMQLRIIERLMKCVSQLS